MNPTPEADPGRVLHAPGRLHRRHLPQQQVAWWRISPVSGQSICVMNTGRKLPK